MITKLFGRFVPVVCSIVLAAGLAACGGGGSDSTPAPTPTGPTITTQPTSATVTAGQTANFTVAATSTQTLTYQWRRGGTNISGANAATYALANTVVADSGAVFSVVVTDAFGSVTSGNATLTVNAATPAITTQPANVSVADGQPANFSVTASNATSYQWKLGGADIAGATAATYMINATTLADTGKVFSVVVTNSAGSVTSGNATLTVTSVAPSITTPPANATVPDGANATFQVTAAGSAPLTYQWQSAPSGSSTFTNIVSATTASYTVTGATLAITGQKYRVVVTNGGGSITSAAGTLTVSGNAPSITTQPAALTKSDGAQATFAVVATGSGTLAYQWRDNGSPIPGETNSTYVISSVALANSGHNFSVVVTSAFGSVTSGNALLTVNPIAVSITAQPAAAPTVLQNGSITFNVTATGSTPITYQWRRNGTNIVGATASGYTLNPALLADNGAHFSVVVNNPASTPVTSSDAVLTVTQTIFPPVISADPASQTKLEGQQASFTVTLSGGTSPTYQWQKQPSGGGSFADLAGETTNTLSFTAAFGDNGAQYRVIVNSTPTSTPATSNAATLTVQQQSVSLLAGQTGGAGYLDGAGTAALFSFPGGVSISTAGITYVADFANDVIRKIATNGATTTLAGKAGVQGSFDGTNLTTTFNSPYDVAAVPDDSAVYVADYANGAIRKVLADGTTTTLPGSFDLPRGLALVGATTVNTGTLYVAEYNGRVIKAIDLTNNNVTVVAGDGTDGMVNANGAAASFSAPTDIAVDDRGTPSPADDILYVADSGNSAIRKIDRGNSDAVTTLVGQFGDSDGNSTQAGFNFASGVALIGTDLFVADTNNQVIRKINLASGSPTTDANYVTTVAGIDSTPGNAVGAGLSSQFFLPYGLAADPSGGRLVVGNFGNNVINQIAISAGPTFTSSALSGSASKRGYLDDPTAANSPPAQFNYPRGLATAANGDSYVADSVNHLIRKVTAAGAVTTYAGTFGQPGTSDGPAVGTASFNDPSGVAVDGAGVVFVADGGSSRIRMINAGGTTVSTVTVGGLVNNPRALAVKSDGSVLYVASSGGAQVIQITNPKTTPVVTVLAGTGIPGSTVGNKLVAQFAGPTGLALDETHGKLYVTDTGNYEVRVIDLLSGTPNTDGSYVTVVAGDHTTPGTQDGTGAGAQFTTIVSAAYDVASGNLYVTDYGAHTLKQIAINTKVVTTIVGDPATIGVQLGSLTSSPLQRRGLNGPTAVQIAPAGATPGTKLFVLDGTEHLVLKVTVLP